ncbi:VOC family protein [Ottowia thiooxydans]|uniref:Methylmalonyl-CoA/ethylmalonyl-CoA epimerase n=1 Tax=Ottowia thiooxydans TaxID=219182 RepID=A0ABV2QE97_9BURK
MPTLNIFRSLHHVCIVVADLDSAIAHYQSLGIGPWKPFPSLEAFREELTAPDPEAFLQLKYAYAELHNVQIQLCQPPQGHTPQRRFLEERGEGVFHLGFDVPNCDEAERAGVGAGLEVLMHGRKPDRSGFTYFQTAATAGVTLEIRSSS